MEMIDIVITQFPNFAFAFICIVILYDLNKRQTKNNEILARFIIQRFYDSDTTMADIEREIIVPDDMRPAIPPK